MRSGHVLGGLAMALPIVTCVAFVAVGCGSLKENPGEPDAFVPEEAPEDDAGPDDTSTGDTGAPDVIVDAGPKTPVKVLGQGQVHTCFTLFDGRLACVGENKHGVLGIGSFVDSPVRVFPTVGGPVKDYAAMSYRGCAVLTNGALQCWGDNRQGVLGTGVPGGDRESPQNITLPFGATQVSLGTDQVFAVLQNGDLMGWGLNFEYQLGDGTRTARPTPGKIALPGKAVRASSGFNASCAVLDDGTLWCWGLAGYLPFDAADAGTHVMLPRLVAGLPDRAVDVAVGITFGCARLENGNVYCWGLNSAGSVGDGTTTDRARPTRVLGLNDAAVAIAVGGLSACARLATGEVRCWGDNSSGQLGDPTKVDHPVPVTVAAAKDATAISIGPTSACAGSATGTVTCWGRPPLDVTSL